jgi:ABC-type lipoprotein export system ATPase subunit
MDDRDLTSFSSREWSQIRKSKLSFIFQGLELFEDLTALENIRLKNRITAYHAEERILEMALGVEAGGHAQFHREPVREVLGLDLDRSPRIRR